MNLKEIKDAARQAFRDQQLQDTEGGVPDAVSFCAGFLAGARYRQAEIDELIMEKDFHAETLIELKSNLKELETFIRADAISTNWENKEYQEAIHYNWLDDEIRRVEHHNFNLQAENKKLREALEFYSNVENSDWGEMAKEALKETKGELK